MNNRIFGYGRVSSKEQNEERQIIAFKELGINERDIYVDKQSGKDFNREQYNLLKHNLRENDLLVIKSIDRLGRNYNMIIEEWRDITKNIKADIKVIDMPILDTSNNKELLGNFMNMKQVLKSIVRYEVHQTDNKKLVLEIRNYINLLDKAEEKLNNLIDQIVIEKKLTRKELRDEWIK